MGRVKLRIKRLESTSNRHVTYSKRRSGILKKAKELSVLCDVDIILLMFSPTGKPTLVLGERSNMEEVIAKFAQLTPQERKKRKLESLEVLKKTFKKLEQDLNIQDFLGPSILSVEELSNQVRLLQAQLTEVHRRLSFWSDPDKIDNIEHLRHMEDSLRESLNRIQMRKETFVRHPLMSLECTSQFQNGMHLPLMMGGVQESLPLPWFHNNENQHMILSGEPNFLPQRDLECSTYPSLNDFDTAACWRLQPNEQYPCSGLDLFEAKMKPEIDMNLQGHLFDYCQINGGFQLPRPFYDNLDHTLVPSTSEPCTMSAFNENSNSQHSK